MNEPIDLYLASSSPRRRELLQQIGLKFQTLSIDVPEVRLTGESPVAYVARLAAQKAKAGALQVRDAPVLGADTIGEINGLVLEKPKDLEDAMRILGLLSGQTHQIHTAITIASASYDGSNDSFCVYQALVTSNVTFRQLSEQEIEAYWATGEPQDKAGAYGIQGLAGRFVSRIEGSYSAIVGLPLMETEQLLKQWWTTHRIQNPQVENNS